MVPSTLFCWLKSVQEMSPESQQEDDGKFHNKAHGYREGRKTGLIEAGRPGRKPRSLQALFGVIFTITNYF